MSTADAIKTLRQNFRVSLINPRTIVCICEKCGKYHDIPENRAVDYIRENNPDGSGKRLSGPCCGAGTMRPLRKAEGFISWHQSLEAIMNEKD